MNWKSEHFNDSKYTKWYFRIIEVAKSKEIDRKSDRDGYYERHHILPRSIHPEFSDFRKHWWNGVYLTSREHFIVHCLLVKMTREVYQGKMVSALMLMKPGSELGIRYYNSRIYEFFKKYVYFSEDRNLKISKSLTGLVRHDQWRKAISDGKIKSYLNGYVQSEEHRRKNSEANSGENNAMYGKKHSDKSKQMMSENRPDQSGKLNPFYGKTHAEETIKRMVESRGSYEKEKNPFYGKKHSDESRLKMRETKRLNKERRLLNDNKNVR